MIDPTTATFTEVEEDGTLVVVGQLALTEGVTIDAAALAASEIPRAVLVAQAKQALLIQLWYLAYGDLGGLIEAIHTHARQTGSLATLQLTRRARALLRPEVPAAALASEAPMADGKWKMADGVLLIAQERARQIRVEGYAAEHDDRHRSGEINDAAICYASAAAKQARGESLEAIQSAVPAGARGFPWPWEDEWWKPSEDPVRNLVKAGALIAAEIDRLQRL